MEFGILGPLTVHRDGEPVDIRGRNQPRLLAILLADSGRLVTINRLIEALWDDNPPATARRQVQNSMAALRRQLGDTVVKVVGDGYRVDLEECEVDQVRFTELVNQAGQCRDRTTDACRLLREALALWRGDALSGVPGRVAATAATRLDESRIAAVEQWAELELREGNHADAEAELTWFANRYPHRQRLAGLLMTALHGGGKTEQALEVYARIRARLAEESGLDPDERLSQLYDAIRCGEPVPQSGVETPSRSETTIPAQLPATAAVFTGRDRQLAALDGLLDTSGAAAVSVVAGMGGAGKTALAVHWAQRERRHFPDGQLYIDLRGFDAGQPVPPVDALQRFLTALGHPVGELPSDLDEAATAYRSLLANRRMLVILDNARDARQVRPLLPGGTRAVTIVTSRNRLSDLTAFADAKPIQLDVLSHGESTELLARLLGDDRVHREPKAARRLAELCGHLPLALRIAAANVYAGAENDVAQYVSRLSTGDRLEQLSIDGDPAAAVSSILDESLAALTEGGRNLLLRLGLIPGEDFADELAVHLSGVSQQRARAWLSALESAHLLERHRPGRYRFHDLVREHVALVARKAWNESTLDEIRQGFIQWHFDRHSSLPVEDGPNLIAALNTWTETPGAWRLAAPLATISGVGHHVAEALRLAEDAVAKAELDDAPADLCVLYRALSGLHSCLGNWTAGLDYARIALSTATEHGIGDPDGSYRGRLALRLAERGEITEAKQLLPGAQAAAVEAKNTKNVVAYSSLLADLYRRAGEYTQAEAAAVTALEYIKEHDPESSPVFPNCQLAKLYRDMGLTEAALAKFDEAIAQAESTTNIRLTSSMLILHGAFLSSLREFDAASQRLSTAQELAERSGQEPLVKHVYMVRAELLSNQGDQTGALRQLDALPPDTADDEADLDYVAMRARIRCLVLTRSKNFAAAIPPGTTARDIYADMPFPLPQARSLITLAEAQAGSGDEAAARASRNEAHAILTRLATPEAAALRERLPG